MMTPAMLIKFLIPTLHQKFSSPYAPHPFPSDLWPIAWSWLTTFYVGVVPLATAMAAAPLARRRRDMVIWGILGAAALATAMGVEPLLTVLRATVPGLRYMTHFSNIMLLVVIALGALAAAGTARVDGRRTTAWTLGVFALVGAAHALIPGVRQATAHGVLGLTALSTEQHRWIAAAGTSTALLSAAAGALLTLKRGRATALIVFTLLDLWIFGRNLQPTVPDAFYHAPVPLAQRLQGTRERLALDPMLVRDDVKPLDGDDAETGYQSLRQVLFLNMQIPFRVHQAWSYEVFPNRRFAEVRRAFSVDQPLTPILNFVGGRYIVSTRALPAPAVLIGRRPNALLYENPQALPRATWVPRAVAADPTETLRRMASDWDPRRVVFLEGDETPPATNTAAARFDWNDDRADRLLASGISDGGWVVWSRTFYPGWEAYVNGEKAELRRADHAFQAVGVPRGDWTTVLIYRPIHIFAAFALAALTAALLATAGLVLLKRI
jgi:hypothetical protein